MNVLQLLLIAGVRRSHSFVPLASVSPRLLSSRRVASALDQEKLVQDMLYRIRQVNQAPPTSCVDFSVDGVVLGKVSPRMVDILTETSVFEMDSSNEVLTLSSAAGTNCESRTDAVQSVMQDLRERGLITGWRDELYPMANSFYNDPIHL